MAMIHEILNKGFEITLQPEGEYIAVVLTRFGGEQFWDYAALRRDFTPEELDEKLSQFFPEQNISNQQAAPSVKETLRRIASTSEHPLT